MARQANRLSVTQKLRLNGSLAASIRVLRFDASGLTRYLEEQASTNPHLVIAPSPVDPAQWLPRWTTAFAAQGVSRYDGPDSGALLQAPTLGLIAHVTREIEQSVTSASDRNIAFALMQALEPSGWLGRNVDAIAAEAGFSAADGLRVLQRLQGIEPTGLFARNLAECLRLQAEEAECLDPVMACVLEHLDMLASGEIERLATLCGVGPPEIMLRLRRIRGFDPKPGAQFGQNAAPVREPDLMVTRGPTGWMVSLNRSALPDVQINDDAEGGAGSLTAARDVQRIVASRNHTLLRISQDILKRQEDIITQGFVALKPMTMQEIADGLDLHVSTISRAVAGVSVDGPRGTVWIRAMFTAGLGDGTGGVAGGAIRARLLNLIRAEDPKHVQSDQVLAEALSQPDAPVARRTIAKYRALLNIPPAHQRRKQANRV
ncbi:RNA polymerase factor sigma-54 [Pseudorhodobacter ferrugineus]|uniref:RNA polymerase factor sigma-54 n=1 Tax=Pseudorhodobacter ferrugineus TaxID=77008 RepID=UPI0003B4FAA6|nr:RNA polymerase factor sigma-54 [Pseudorhodobacter ferrugineus]